MVLRTNFGQKPFCTCIHQSDISHKDYIHWTSLWLVLVSLYNHTTKWSIHLHSVWSKQPLPNAPPVPFMQIQYELNIIFRTTDMYRSTSMAPPLITDQQPYSYLILTYATALLHKWSMKTPRKWWRARWERERQSIGQVLSEETLKEKRTNAQENQTLIWITSTLTNQFIFWCPFP